MKKQIISAFALAAAISLSACGGSAADTVPSAAGEPSAEVSSEASAAEETTPSAASETEEETVTEDAAEVTETQYCPYVIGYTEDEAKNELEQAGLDVNINAVPDSRFVPGTVIGQSIMDIEVSSSDEITLTVTEWGDKISLISENSVTGYAEFPVLYTYKYDDTGRLIETKADSYDCWETFHLSDATDGKYRLARTSDTRYSYDDSGMTVTASRTDTEISIDGTENSSSYEAVIYFDGERLGSDPDSICSSEDRLYGDIYWGYMDNGYYESCTCSYDDNGNIISIISKEDSSDAIYPCEEFAYIQTDSASFKPETLVLNKLLIQSGPSVAFIDWQPAE